MTSAAVDAGELVMEIPVRPAARMHELIKIPARVRFWKTYISADYPLPRVKACVGRTARQSYNPQVRESVSEPSASLEGCYTTIIPVRSEDPFLCEALDSILAQSLEPGPILVVVNGNDPTESQSALNVRKYQGRIELLTSLEIGMVPAINVGIANTKTEFVAFLDSDDLWVTDKQEKQLQLLLDRPELDAATSRASNFRTEADGGRKILMNAEASMFTATTFRRSTFDKFGALDPESTHFTWLYRWWSSAHEQGIRTESIGATGALRRIHSTNSWVVENEEGNGILLSELRSIVQQRRSRQLQGNE